MLLEATSAPAPAPPRRWHPPDRVSCVPEPGRLPTNALVNVARHARGCQTAGDDRLETRAYAVKRLLHRWSHAQRSARFACSVAQLVRALAPIMGWGEPPAGRLERDRWVRAHRKSVQRWLDDLQAAGLLVYEGERDNRGQLWRTLITLLPAPEPPDEQLQVARRRLKAFRRRSRRRQSYRRRRARAQRLRRAHTPLEAVLAASARPQRATRARLARRRACALHERRRRAGVDAQLAALEEHKRDRTHPFGAPTTSERLPVIPETLTEPAAPQPRDAATPRSAQTPMDREAFAEMTGAHTREDHDGHGSARRNRVSTEDEGARPARDPWEALEARIAARYAATQWRRHEAARQALERARALAAAPPEARWGLGRLREAWVVFRYGLELRDAFDEPRSGPERVGDHGSTNAGARRPGQLARAARAIALYEQHADQRPPDWPASGASALCALAAHARAASLEGDIARLRMLAKNMRAAALHADPERVERARRRAQRRAQPPSVRFAFRLARLPRPRWETPEARRWRVRDELLGAGEHPGLSGHVFDEAWEAILRHDAGSAREGDPASYRLPDGMTERAQRYQRELADGHWALPEDWRLRGAS